MAEALDTSELVAALDDADDRFPLNDLPNDLLVSVFEAVGDLRWVRGTVPLVCKAWNELYRSQNASPLHETLEVDFRKEVASEAAREGEARGGFRSGDGHPRTQEAWEWALRQPVHASRIISWTERRAGWVRKLRLKGETFRDFSPEDLRTLVAVAASSLTEISIRSNFDERYIAPFWESLRDSVAHHGRLRSLVVGGSFANVSESNVERLGQLAGSLEELELGISSHHITLRLQRFPESLCALTELRRLALVGHQRITAIPAQISCLKKLKELEIRNCGLSSLPKELGELSGLTELNLAANRTLGDVPQDEAFPAELVRMKSLRHLDLGRCGLDAVPAFVGELEALEILKLTGNEDLGDAPQDEAFPAALGRLKSLRVLNLRLCGLRAVPAFVGELESLEVLDLSGNEEEIFATLDFLIEGCPRLREVKLDTPQTPESRAHIEDFEARLPAKDPNAAVTYDE